MRLWVVGMSLVLAVVEGAAQEVKPLHSPVVLSSTSDFQATNMPIVQLVAEAYSVDVLQVVAPQWMQNTRETFTVSALPGQAHWRDQLQQELAKRFSLVVENRTEPMEVYVLRLTSGSRIIAKREDAAAKTVHQKIEVKTTAANRLEMITTQATPDMLASQLRRLTGELVLDEIESRLVPDLQVSWEAGSTEQLLYALQQQAGLLTERSSRPMQRVYVVSAKQKSR